MLCDTLTNVCEESLVKQQGFEWITHIVNYQKVAVSLKVICVFDTVEAKDKAEHSEYGEQLRQLIIDKLEEENIVFKNSAKQISFDSEEACEIQHQGNWNARLNSH